MLRSGIKLPLLLLLFMLHLLHAHNIGLQGKMCPSLGCDKSCNCSPTMLRWYSNRTHLHLLSVGQGLASGIVSTTRQDIRTSCCACSICSQAILLREESKTQSFPKRTCCPTPYARSWQQRLWVSFFPLESQQNF